MYCCVCVCVFFFCKSVLVVCRFNSLWEVFWRKVCTNYNYIKISHLHSLKIKIGRELVQVQKHIRQNLHTVKLHYGELILRRNFRTAKYPYDEISLRLSFLTAKLLYGEISYGEFSYGKFPTAKFPSANVGSYNKSLFVDYDTQIFPTKKFGETIAR